MNTRLRFDKLKDRFEVERRTRGSVLSAPAAFGETGVKRRIKNVLKFKKPGIGVTVVTVVLCLAAAAACAANPEISEAPSLYGNYKFEKQLYINLLSSFLALEGFEEYYTFSEHELTITDMDGDKTVIPVEYERSDFSEKEFSRGFMLGFGAPDITQYDKRYMYDLNGYGSGFPRYRLYFMDDEIWLAKMTQVPKSDSDLMFWSIYKISRFDGELPGSLGNPAGTFTHDSYTLSRSLDGVDTFISLQGDFDSGYENDACYNVTADDVKEAGYSVFKYDTSCASFLLYENSVYPLGEWFGGLGVTSMAIRDSDNDGLNELYYTYSWGSGIHRSHAAYFDPAVKRSIVFDYTRMNEDMVFIPKGDALLLYDAGINDMESSTWFEMKTGEYIGEIGFEDGNIVLKTSS